MVNWELLNPLITEGNSTTLWKYFCLILLTRQFGGVIPLYGQTFDGKWHQKFGTFHRKFLCFECKKHDDRTMMWSCCFNRKNGDHVVPTWVITTSCDNTMKTQNSSKNGCRMMTKRCCPACFPKLVDKNSFNSRFQFCYICKIYKFKTWRSIFISVRKEQLKFFIVGFCLCIVDWKPNLFAVALVSFKCCK